MKKAFVYFGLQLKKAMRYFPFILALSLAMCVGLGIALNAVVSMDSASEDKQKITVGIVGDADGSYLGFGISALQTLDSSRFVVEFEEMTENEARTRLEKGEISAYAIIPEGFVDSAVQGDIKQINYVTTDSAVGVTTIFMDEMLEAISCMLVESQKGVYGLQGVMWENGLRYGEHSEKLASEYFSLILSRSNISKQEITGYSESLSFGGYMFCGVFVLFMLLCGISFCPIYVKRDISLSRLMNASGRSVFSQVMGEYFSFFLMMFANVYIIVCAISLFAGDSLGFIPELDDANILWSQGVAVKLIPSLLVITALQFLIYEFSTGLIGGVLAQFLGAVALAYVSGCFYPISFFPDVIQTFSAVLPTGAARSYVSAVLYGDADVGDIVKLAFFFVFLMFAVIAKRRRRVARG